MSQELDQAGTFRVNITGYGVNENNQTGTLGVIVECQILEAWDPQSKDWVNWRESDVATSGYLNLIKKDGTDNEIGVRSLAAAGWSGELPDICEERWRPVQCQAVVKLNNKSGKMSVDNLSDYNREPGQVTNIDVQRARQIQMQHGGAFRAIIGNAKRIAAPASAPPAPPIAGEPLQVESDVEPADEIPF